MTVRIRCCDMGFFRVRYGLYRVMIKPISGCGMVLFALRNAPYCVATGFEQFFIIAKKAFSYRFFRVHISISSVCDDIFIGLILT